VTVLSDGSARVTQVTEDDSCDVPPPSRGRKLRSLALATAAVALLSGTLLTASSIDAGARHLLNATSVGIGTFAFSYLFLLFWGVGGVVTGRVLGSGTRWGLACGAGAGLLGQAVAALTAALAAGPMQFPLAHLAAYAALGALTTGLFGAAAAYYYEEKTFWRNLQALE